MSVMFSFMAFFPEYLESKGCIFKMTTIANDSVYNFALMACHLILSIVLKAHICCVSDSALNLFFPWFCEVGIVCVDTLFPWL